MDSKNHSNAKRVSALKPSYRYNSEAWKVVDDSRLGKNLAFIPAVDGNRVVAMALKVLSITQFNAKRKGFLISNRDNAAIPTRLRA